MVRDTESSCQAPAPQFAVLPEVVVILACVCSSPPATGAPVLSAAHTCTTQEGPPPELRENGRLTEVTV